MSASLRTMPGSRADRPYGSFLPLFSEESDQAPLQPATWRRRARQLLDRTRTSPALAIAGLAGLLIVSIVVNLTPPARQLTDADVAAAIKQALASATPKPNIAITAYDNVKESVVMIAANTRPEGEFRARGSGVVFDTGQTIITSLHILEGAFQIKVVFFDGEENRARVTDRFPEYDIALLATDASARKPAVMASARNLKVGDEAFVVGSPLGQQNSLSAGVISKLGSTFIPTTTTDTTAAQRSYGGLIQFNAAVYPGNSGGALVNRLGEVVGIVTWVADGGGVSGIGFAVPMDAASSAPGSNPF